MSTAQAIIQRYNIRYIYVGTLEKRKAYDCLAFPEQ